MNVKPFRFKLAKVSSKEQRALEALFEFLPKTGMRDKLHAAIIETLSSHLNRDTTYNLEAVTQESFESFCNKIPDPAVVVVLGTAPREGKILLEVDANLASFLVERLLGADAQTLPSPKSLSEIEQGVLQYLILQLLAHIYRLCGNDSRVHFRFEKFLFSAKSVKEIVPLEANAFILNLKISIGKSSGFVRLVFPSPLVEKLYLGIEAKGEARQAEYQYLLSRLTEFGHIEFPIWAEGGRVTITAGDIENLETGDVIVLEDTSLKLDEKGLSGKTVLRAGDGTHGGFISEISADPKKIHCRIVDVQKGEDIL